MRASLLVRLQSQSGVSLLEVNGVQRWQCSDASDLELALDILAEYDRPAHPNILTRTVQALKSACKERRSQSADQEAQFELMERALGAYPADIARAFAHGWMEQETFVPAISEIHNGCKELMWWRNNTKAKIQALIRKREDARALPKPRAKGLKDSKARYESKEKAKTERRNHGYAD